MLLVKSSASIWVIIDMTVKCIFKGVDVLFVGHSVPEWGCKNVSGSANDSPRSRMLECKDTKPKAVYIS